MASYNLSIRLVRSAGNTLSGTVSSSSEVEKMENAGKMLVAYFSWSGNTQGVAEEIQRQTGADIFEIVPIGCIFLCRRRYRSDIRPHLRLSFHASCCQTLHKKFLTKNKDQHHRD